MIGPIQDQVFNAGPIKNGWSDVINTAGRVESSQRTGRQLSKMNHCELGNQTKKKKNVKHISCILQHLAAYKVFLYILLFDLCQFRVGIIGILPILQMQTQIRRDETINPQRWSVSETRHNMPSSDSWPASLTSVCNTEMYLTLQFLLQISLMHKFIMHLYKCTVMKIKIQ